VVFRPLDESWVLFDPRTRRVHELNLTAATLWALLDGTLKPPELARRLAEVFDEPPPEADLLAQVRDALATFAEHGLLEP